MKFHGDWVSGNIFIRPNVLEKKGDVCNGHAHKFDHTTILFKGAVHVKAKKPILDGDGNHIKKLVGQTPAMMYAPDSTSNELVPRKDKSGRQLFEDVYEDQYQLIREQDFKAPSHFWIDKNLHHEITAIHSSYEDVMADFDKFVAEYPLLKALSMLPLLRSWIGKYLASDQRTEFWCVYSHNTPQGDISQVYDGWEQAYH